MERYISLLGIFVFTFFAWSASRDRRAINVRLLFWTMLFQFIFAWFVFKSAVGQNVFLQLNSIVTGIVDAALAGPQFVFGPLADPAAADKIGLGFMLFFQGLATIFVFSALLAILYHVGLMSRLLRIFAGIFSYLTRISGAEALSAAANVFVGNESLLTIRPCLPKLTRSEYCTLLATCMATISANVIGIYVGALRTELPSIAGHLVSASILSVPAAVLLAKLAMPEKETPETLGVDVTPHFERDPSLVEAVLGSGETGFKMVLGITSMLIAVVGLLAIVNAFFGWGGGHINQLFGWSVTWSIESFLGLIFYPFVWLMGVPANDVPSVANLMGMRMIATEVPAYFALSEMMKAGAIAPRSAVIAAYALCGFTHLPSLAIYVGGATALAPGRKSDIASVAWIALFVATLACLLTGSFAGLFFSSHSLLY